MLTKTQLIGKIYAAFTGVTLEDGIGIWEGLALDDRLEHTAAYKRLKSKDERLDWQKIPVIDLYKCSSSISFHDAKGMRFNLGLYLLFALNVFEDEEDKLHKDKNFNLSPPEVMFALKHNLESDYSKNRFSLLNKKQIQCVIHFLEYHLKEQETYFNTYGAKNASKFNKKYIEQEEAVAFWKIQELLR